MIGTRYVVGIVTKDTKRFVLKYSPKRPKLTIRTDGKERGTT